MNNLCTDVGYHSLYKHGEQLCGDHVDVIEKGDDYTVLVLADRSWQRVKGKYSFNSYIKNYFHNDGE